MDNHDPERQRPEPRSSIAFASRNYDQHGGVGNVMSQLAERASRDFNVTIAASQIENPPRNAATLHIPSLSRPAFLRLPTFATTAAALMPRFDFDLVHAHDSHMLGADIYTVHSSFKGYIEHRRKTGSIAFSVASHVYLPHVTLLALNRLAYSRPNSRIVAVSDSVRSELLHAYDLDPTRVSVVYNGVDIERFGELDRAHERRSLEALLRRNLKGKIVACFVGHEFGRKRLSTTIRAIARARARNDIELIVVGDGDSTRYRAEARSHGLHDQVHFLGRRADVPELMYASDVFTFPTEYEAASLALLEAAASGLAIATTDVAMAHELFTDGTNALLLENTAAPEPLSSALDQLASGALRLRLGAEARRLAENYSWNSVWLRYREIYDDVLTDRAARRSHDSGPRTRTTPRKKDPR